MSDRDPRLNEALAMLDEAHRLERAAKYAPSPRECYAVLTSAGRLRAQSQRVARRIHGEAFRGRM